MSDFRHTIRPVIQTLKPYSLKSFDCDSKLNQNESPYDLPPEFKKEILQEFSALPWNRYPSYTNDPLTEKLAAFLEVDLDRVLIGNGSNELLQMLISLILPVRSEILIVAPTFSIYQQLAQLAEAEISEIEFAADWSFPVEKIIAYLRKRPVNLCILCSPNSPTGAILPEDDLARILESTQGLVLLDEAYHEFSGSHYLELQKEFGNLIISRTFSKAMGLAGLRIGYLVANAELMQHISKAKLPYNLNIFSEFVAGKLLERPDLIRQNVRKILNAKGALFEELQTMDPLRVYPSHANFIMIETRFPARQVFEELAQTGILIRDISGHHPRLKRMLRITVGTPEENSRLIASLREILAKMDSQQ